MNRLQIFSSISSGGISVAVCNVACVSGLAIPERMTGGNLSIGVWQVWDVCQNVESMVMESSILTSIFSIRPQPLLCVKAA